MIRAIAGALMLLAAAVGGFAAGTSAQLLEAATDVVAGCR